MFSHGFLKVVWSIKLLSGYSNMYKKENLAEKVESRE
jgi:hypothetical protein